MRETAKIVARYILQRLSLGKIRWKGGPAIYLTFDDGPHPQGTPALLDTLSRYNARATFFVLGENAAQYPELIQRIESEGHTVGNHSYSHPRFSGETEKFLQDFRRCDTQLGSEPGERPVRIPYGTITPGLLTRLFFSPYRAIYWNKDTKDFELGAAEEVSEHLDIDNLRNGDIILMHDFPEVTPKLVEKMLQRHRDKVFSAL